MRIMQLCMIAAGSILSAYGITLAIFAGFGSATLGVLWQGVALSLGISLGQASYIVAGVMILFSFFYDRRQLHVGTILYQALYGAFVDIFAKVHVYSRFIWLNFVLMLLGIILFALGTSLYASADWGRGSYEAVTYALAEKNRQQIKTVRIILDAAVVIIGVCLGGEFGLCTICTILLSGPVIQWSAKRLAKWKQRLGLSF